MNIVNLLNNTSRIKHAQYNTYKYAEEETKQNEITQDKRFIKDDPISRLIGNTVGRAGAIVSGTPLITKDMSSVRNANLNELTHMLTSLDDEFKDRVKETEIHVGGGMNFPRTIKRIWTNKNTTLPMKLFTTTVFPQLYLNSLLTRGAMYLHAADSVYAPTDNLGVVAHELGHAADFNRMNAPSNASYLKRLPHKITRDLYSLLASFRGLNLIPENNAWSNARIITRSMLDNKKVPKEIKEKILKQYSHVRVPAFSTYITSPLLPAATLPTAAVLSLTNATDKIFRRDALQGTKYEKELKNDAKHREVNHNQASQ